MDCKTLAVALIVACAGSGAKADAYSSPLSGMVEVCLPECGFSGPWFGEVIVTTNEGGDGLFSGTELQSISVSSYAYAGPRVTLLDFDSDGFGVGLDGSAAAWPTVTISNGQIGDIEELYTGDGAQWDFSNRHVGWSNVSGSIVAFAGIGAVPEASSRAMLLLGVAALALSCRSTGRASRRRRAGAEAPADAARAAA